MSGDENWSLSYFRHFTVMNWAAECQVTVCKPNQINLNIFSGYYWFWLCRFVQPSVWMVIRWRSVEWQTETVRIQFHTTSPFTPPPLWSISDCNVRLIPVKWRGQGGAQTTQGDFQVLASTLRSNNQTRLTRRKFSRLWKSAEWETINIVRV